MAKPRSTTNRAEEIWRGPPDDAAQPWRGVPDPRAQGDNEFVEWTDAMRSPDRSAEGEANEGAVAPGIYDPTWLRQHKEYTRLTRDEVLRRLGGS